MRIKQAHAERGGAWSAPTRLCPTGCDVARQQLFDMHPVLGRLFGS